MFGELILFAVDVCGGRSMMFAKCFTCSAALSRTEDVVHCAKCCFAVYCGYECQKGDYETHRSKCRDMAETMYREHLTTHWRTERGRQHWIQNAVLHLLKHCFNFMDPVAIQLPKPMTDNDCVKIMASILRYNAGLKFPSSPSFQLGICVLHAARLIVSGDTTEASELLTDISMLVEKPYVDDLFLVTFAAVWGSAMLIEHKRCCRDVTAISGIVQKDKSDSVYYQYFKRTLYSWLITREEREGRYAEEFTGLLSVGDVMFEKPGDVSTVLHYLYTTRPLEMLRFCEEQRPLPTYDAANDVHVATVFNSLEMYEKAETYATKALNASSLNAVQAFYIRLTLARALTGRKLYHLAAQQFQKATALFKHEKSVRADSNAAVCLAEDATLIYETQGQMKRVEEIDELIQETVVICDLQRRQAARLRREGQAAKGRDILMPVLHWYQTKMESSIHPPLSDTTFNERCLLELALCLDSSGNSSLAQKILLSIEEDQAILTVLRSHIQSGLKNEGTSRKKKRRHKKHVEECAVCFFPIDGSESRTLKCGHVFCKTCISNWVHKCRPNAAGATCPMCRSLI